MAKVGKGGVLVVPKKAVSVFNYFCSLTGDPVGGGGESGCEDWEHLLLQQALLGGCRDSHSNPRAVHFRFLSSQREFTAIQETVVFTGFDNPEAPAGSLYAQNSRFATLPNTCWIWSI